MKKSKRELTRQDVRVFENEKARDIYINSSFALYQDNKGVFYLDEIDYGAQIEYCVSGTITDIEEYILATFEEE